MMVSMQTICMTPAHIPQPGIRMASSRIPQSGICIHSPVSLVPRWRRPADLKWSSGFPKSRGDSEQASSLVCGAGADAALDDHQVPAKDAAVHDLTGTKTMEHVDSISPTKLVSTIDDQLPPLLSMIIDGFPPLQQSPYIHEAEKRLHQYAKRYPNVISLYAYCHVGLSSASYGHPRAINLNRLVIISINYALLFLLDDLFFDTPDEFLQDQYGVSHSICKSPKKIQEYLDYLDAVFSQQVQPCNSTPIETLMWEIGRDTLELSNLEWFNHYVIGVVEHHRASVASHVDIVQGRNLYFQDVESYALMRAGNIGGTFIQLMIEFAKDIYIPRILRANPYFKEVTTTTSIHLGFVNDVFSYHKESSLEQNPRNLITVLMECEGKPFVKTLHMAIDLVNTYACVIMDLEAKAWNPILQNHLHDIKALIAGSVYYSSMETRYRHPDSVFPELRDMTSSWKILPHAKGLGL